MTLTLSAGSPIDVSHRMDPRLLLVASIHAKLLDPCARQGGEGAAQDRIERRKRLGKRAGAPRAAATGCCAGLAATEAPSPVHQGMGAAVSVHPPSSSVRLQGFILFVSGIFVRAEAAGGHYSRVGPCVNPLHRAVRGPGWTAGASSFLLPALPALVWSSVLRPYLLPPAQPASDPVSEASSWTSTSSGRRPILSIFHFVSDEIYQVVLARANVRSKTTVAEPRKAKSQSSEEHGKKCPSSWIRWSGDEGYHLQTPPSNSTS
ncbi:hypothetical protein FB451DRAFT_1187630 [Mycena latifolia]|nr:hypothetical protein FB451DRAFT_1187630 [Mycena latifolia]